MEGLDDAFGAPNGPAMHRTPSGSGARVQLAVRWPQASWPSRPKRNGRRRPITRERSNVAAAKKTKPRALGC